MTELVNDPWIVFGCKLSEEFFTNHRDTMPEDPYDVWRKNEINYFLFAFTLWAARQKFRIKKGVEFEIRAVKYLGNVKRNLNDSVQIGNYSDDEIFSYDVYKDREKEYTSLLTKGSSSIFGAIVGSIFQPACKAFVLHSCKRYIFSERDLVKIFHPWLIEKGMEFDKNIPYT
jgi:hypothetical protein